MSDLIEKIFPAEQCLSDEVIALAENLTEICLVDFFRIHGPAYYGYGLGSQTYTESPFTLTYSDVQVQGINYEALGSFSIEMAELRQKLLEK